MKKSFRNRLLAVAAVAVSSVMLLAGFDSSMTVEDLYKKTQEANASLTDFSAHASANGDIKLDVSASGTTQSMPMSGSMDMDIQYTLSPLQFCATGTASGDASALGMAGEIGMDMYMVNSDDGSYTTYVKISGLGDEAGWEAAKIPAESAQQMNDMVAKAMAGDYSEIEQTLGIDVAALQEEFMGKAALAPEAVTVEGRECYELTMTLTGEDIGNLLNAVAEAKPETIDPTTVQMIQMFAGSLQFNLIQDIDVETFRPVYVKLDMAGSDFTMIGQIIGSLMFSSSSEDEEAPAPEVQLTVNDLSMEYTYDWETPVSIEVPEEALGAEVTEIDPEALAGEAMDIAA